MMERGLREESGELVTHAEMGAEVRRVRDLRARQDSVQTRLLPTLAPGHQSHPRGTFLARAAQWAGSCLLPCEGPWLWLPLSVVHAW